MTYYGLRYIPQLRDIGISGKMGLIGLYGLGFGVEDEGFRG